MAHQIIVLDRHEIVQAVLGDGPSACPILEDLHVEKLENAAITYEFAVPADHPDAQTIAPEGYVIIRDLDGLLQELRIKTVEDELDSEGKRIRRVVAENAALELNGSIIRPTIWTGVTASQALTNALTGTRWQPGIVEWSGTRTITIDGYKTVTEVLHQIASEFEAEIRWHVVWQDGRIVGRFVDLLRQRGRYTGKRFEYAKDVTGLRRIEDTTELVTAMIGVGKADENGKRLTFVDVTWSKANGDPADKPQGQDWVGDEDALQRWGLPGGRHIFGIYDDPDEEDPNKLLQKTWNALQQRVNSRYTYEVEVALLERLAEQVEPAREPEYYSLQAQFYAQFEGQPLPRDASGWEHEAVRLGDTATIHDTSVDPPLVLEARVIEVQRSYVDPTRDKVVLGYYRPLITTLPKVVADLQKRLNQKQGLWDSKQRPVAVGSTPPSNPQINDLWVDTSSTPHVWKRWDGVAWQKATPTQAAEVGAETPAGAQAKADQAEANAKQAVANGEVPIPTSALQGIIDAAVNLIQATQGWVYIDQNGLIVYNHQDPAQATKAVKVGAGGILLANSKTNGQWNWRTAITGDGIVADEVRTGTMLFDRVRGGTAELGGSGNGNGVLIVRDANGNERVRVDNTGVVVDAANYRIRKDVEYVITPTPNLVLDHSFELCPLYAAAEYPDLYTTGGSNGPYEGWSFNDGRIYRGNVPYGERAAYFSYGLNNYAVQRVRVASTNPHTVSLEAIGASSYGVGTDGTLRVIVRAINSSGGVISTLFTWDIAADVSWTRFSKTTGNLPSGTYYLEIELRCVGGSGADPAVLVDGVQIVEGSYPVLYDPEQSTFNIANSNLQFVTDPVWGGTGLIRAADVIDEVFRPPSIRITRTSNQSVSSGVATAISWQGLYEGYNSSDMWDPSQPDPTKIFVPEHGKYLIICTVRWSANGNGYRLMAINVNGGDNIAKKQEAPVSGNPMYQQVSGVVHLNAGDYIQIVVVQNSGSTLNLEVESQTAPVLQMIKQAP